MSSKFSFFRVLFAFVEDGKVLSSAFSFYSSSSFSSLGQNLAKSTSQLFIVQLSLSVIQYCYVLFSAVLSPVFLVSLFWPLAQLELRMTNS